MEKNHQRVAFYLDELNEWGDHIDFYHQETEELESRLSALIRRNNVPHIAEKVEQRQEALNRISSLFINLQHEIAELERQLNPSEGTVLSAVRVDDSTERRQAVLRINMQAAEKAYIDTRYDCHQFLSDILKT